MEITNGVNNNETEYRNQFIKHLSQTQEYVNN